MAPLRVVFDAANPVRALQLWHDFFIWKRRKPYVEGMVALACGPRRRHAWIGISMDSEKADFEKLTIFLKAAVVRFDADFASLHALNQSDIATGLRTSTVLCLDPKRAKYSLSIASKTLFQYLPDLYWLTVFGKPYVGLFGRDRLLSAPAFVIRDLDEYHISIQLSDSPLDFVTQFADVDVVRQVVKLHLNHNAFFDLFIPIDSVYEVPQFELKAG